MEYSEGKSENDLRRAELQRLYNERDLAEEKVRKARIVVETHPRSALPFAVGRNRAAEDAKRDLDAAERELAHVQAEISQLGGENA